MKEEDREKLKDAFEVIRRLSPKMFEVLKRGFHTLNCDKRNDVEQIESLVRMYLYAKNINLAPRVVELLIWFVKHDTSTSSRKIISRKIGMTGGTINQNASKLKKAGLLIYPYDDSKKSIVDPALIRLKDYIMDESKGNNILVTFDG